MPRTALPLLLALPLTSCSLFRERPPDYAAVALDEAGLSIRDVVVPDEGPEVAEGDTVAIHYDLWLPDKTLVESSRTTGSPLRIKVGSGAVPRGLEKGLIGMRLYGRRRVEVPSALGFGTEGRPPSIPPDSDLVFEVEVMEHDRAGKE